MQEPVAKPAWSAKQQKNPNSNALPVAFQRDQLLSAQAGEACKEERQSVAAQTDTVLLAFCVVNNWNYVVTVYMTESIRRRNSVINRGVDGRAKERKSKQRRSGQLKHSHPAQQ
jgi:hypothetical protein